MARDKTGTGKGVAPVATIATPATWKDPIRAGIEAGLDDVVRLILKSGPKEAIPEWLVLWPRELSFLDLGQAKVETFTEELAATLVEMAATNRHAFDAAAYIVGMALAVGPLTGWASLPASLRLFGARVLARVIERPPKKGRPRADDVHLRLTKYALCRYIADRTPLPLTRNRNPSGPATFTVCDAVAEAFTRAGSPETQEQLASLCYDSAHADLRAFAKAMGLLDSDDC